MQARLVGYQTLILFLVSFSTLYTASLASWVSKRRYRLKWLRRRHAAPPAREFLDDIDSKPILLLRAFSDDEIQLGDGSGPDRFTFEEAIAQQLWLWGPVVAIGQPGEDLPQSGAAREYVSSDDWQVRVKGLFHQAQAIVVTVHDTPGLKWEVDKIREHGLLGRTLFVFPPVPEEEAIRRWQGLWGVSPEVDNPNPPKGSMVAYVPTTDRLLTIGKEDGQPGPNDFNLAVELGIDLSAKWREEVTD